MARTLRVVFSDTPRDKEKTIGDFLIVPSDDKEAGFWKIWYARNDDQECWYENEDLGFRENAEEVLKSYLYLISVADVHRVVLPAHAYRDHFKQLFERPIVPHLVESTPPADQTPADIHGY